MFVKFLVFVFGLSYGSIVLAEIKDPTGLLYRECQRTDKEAFFCMTNISHHKSNVESRGLDYIRGIMLIMELYPETFNVNDPKTKTSLEDMAATEIDARYGCIQDKSRTQLTQVFLKWAKNNPEKWHFPIWMSLTDAFAEAFPPPCNYRGRFKYKL